MRKILMLAASATVVSALAANAQEAPTQQPSPPPASAPDAAPAIQRVSVVDVSELPEETQKQVDQVVAQTSSENLQQMRSTIDATPQIKAALEAKGVSSAQVVATSMGPDGTLTLITKKAS